MTDKVQKILSEIATRKLCTMDEHMAFYNDKAKEDYRFLSEIEEIIKGMQEEPVSEEFEEALANEWKGYIDRGAATVDALEDNTQELAFAKGFYRGAKWKEQKDSIVSKNLKEACEQLAENARKHKAETTNPFFSPTDYKQGVVDGTNWKEQQMIAKAIDVVIGNEWGHPRCVLTQYDLEPLGIRSKDRVKVIVIKED